MTAAILTAVALAAAAFVLRCTILAPATGRHYLRKHRGWEGRIGELRALTEKPGRHAQRIKTCGQVHPDRPGAACTLPAHHHGERHEQRFGNVLRCEWFSPQLVGGAA